MPNAGFLADGSDPLGGLLLMSYILDALRRSEKARRLGEVPGLPSVVASQQRARPHWAIWLIAFLLIVNALVLGFWFLSSEFNFSTKSEQVVEGPVALPPQAHEVQQSSGAARLGGPTQATVPFEAGQSPNAGEPEGPVSEESQSLPNNLPRTNAELSGTSALKSEQPTELADEINKIEESPVAKKNRAEIYESDEDESDESLLASNKKVVVPGERRGLEEKPDLPYFSQLDSALQDQISKITFNMYAYGRDRAERFVIIEGRKFQIGNQLPNGSEVIDIQPESIILEYHGQRFRYPRVSE